MKLIFSKADLFPSVRWIGNNEIDDAQSILLLEFFDHLLGLIASNDSALLFK